MVRKVYEGYMDGYKLIYHDKESSTGEISPFDKVITDMVKNRDVSVVCPYIGIDYFNRIIQLSNTWFLVTDVEEWIISHNTKTRKIIKDFIQNNLSTVRHHKDVHAKVIITDNKAFISSSNLTDKGITKRVEMGVLIEEKKHVKELQDWFCDLWNKSKPINIQDLEKYITSIRSLPSYEDICKSKIKFPSNPDPINTKLVDIGSNVEGIIKNNQESHKRLVEVIRKIAPNREWINDYFDLAKEIIEFTGLKSDDLRLVTSLPKSYNSLSITINQRWILRYKLSGEVGLIMPIEYAPE
ncbi:MAG: hypothetical protein DRO92_03265, partial [Candidatus Altiarchaeales archaeon]